MGWYVRPTEGDAVCMDAIRRRRTMRRIGATRAGFVVLLLSGATVIGGAAASQAKSSSHLRLETSAGAALPSSVPTPGVGGTLRAVSCVSPSDCWAVGVTGNRVGGGLNEALHWNGSKWSASKVPQPDGTRGNVNNALNGVSCVGSRACWAVGGAGVTRQEALRWNGRKW